MPNEPPAPDDDYWTALLADEPAPVAPVAPVHVATDGTVVPGQSWDRIDLTAVLRGLLDGSIERLAPTVGTLTGGTALFYAGKVNGVAGASGSGKTWTLLATSCQEIAAGRHVIYVDLEGDAVGLVGRLLDLGAHPPDVLARFHYVRPDEGYRGAAKEQLRGLVAPWRPRWSSWTQPASHSRSTAQSRTTTTT